MNDRLEKAHRASIHHRKQLETSSVCGCFYCGAIFSPQEITEWIDNDDTALCPYCGIDSVLGDSSGFPVTKEFLGEMRKYWFW